MTENECRRKAEQKAANRRRRDDPHKGPHKSGQPHRGSHKAANRRPQRDPHRKHTDILYKPSRSVFRSPAAHLCSALFGLKSERAKSALQLLMNRYGSIRFAQVRERVSTKSFVVLIIGNSKSFHLGAQGTFKGSP